MDWRESFDVEPMIHSNPIPSATRTGNMLFTSLIAGRNDDGTLPDSGEAQAANAFRILRRILERAGVSHEEVAHLKVHIREPAVRAFVNVSWLEMFPDAGSRPARHTTVEPGLAEMVQIEAIAVLKNGPAG
jgi:enamine deaminase RidA (YjgF/YER057c/UK114 family)